MKLIDLLSEITGEKSINQYNEGGSKMVTRRELILKMKEAITALSREGDPDDTVMMLVDEGGYTESYRALSHIDMNVTTHEDEDEDVQLALMSLELEFVDR